MAAKMLSWETPFCNALATIRAQVSLLASRASAELTSTTLHPIDDLYLHHRLAHVSCALPSAPPLHSTLPHTACIMQGGCCQVGSSLALNFAPHLAGGHPCAFHGAHQSTQHGKRGLGSHGAHKLNALGDELAGQRGAGHTRVLLEDSCWPWLPEPCCF